MEVSFDLVGGRVRCCSGEQKERNRARHRQLLAGGLGRPHRDVSMIPCSDNAMGLRCTA